MSEPKPLPKTGVELADVVRRFGPKYTTRYAGRMMPSQRRALADIAACCTEALGGRRYRCDDCQESFWQYHACRNRSCPSAKGNAPKRGSSNVRPNSCVRLLSRGDDRSFRVA